ncbi:serine/threonine-protein kinase [Streptomyces sp. NPDC049906]|uniref:serine/threonine-protein kinase n=1 Tax=Streptomyces sp. NPDC049906 TaxID=3155656 RepID=UPI003431E00B
MREGEVLDGRYVFVQRLAITATSEVWKAYDQGTDRPVTIKFLPANIDDSLHNSLLQRFRREADVLNLVKHPAIPEIYEIRDREHGTGPSPYLVREFVRGSTLAHVLSQRRPTAPQALCVAIQLTEALRFVHNRGVIHRDLKPGNLMIDESGKVHLLDFGVAYVVGAEPSSQERIAGTLPYMAPEQITGNRLDGRADIYALGCILYEMLTGFPAVSDETLLPRRPLQQVHNSLAPLAHHSLEVPPGIGQLTSKLLAKSPDDRPGMSEILDTLRAHLPADGDEKALHLSPPDPEGDKETLEYFAPTIPPGAIHRLHELSTCDPAISLNPTASYRMLLAALQEDSLLSEIELKESKPPSLRTAEMAPEFASWSAPADADEDVGPAADALEGALAQLFVRLGPPPDLAGNETVPVGSDGGEGAE